MAVGSPDPSSTVVMKVGSVVSGIVLGDTAILTELNICIAEFCTR